MRKLLVGLAASLALATSPAFAQYATVMGQYNSGGVTAANGQSTPVQMDSAGNVKVVTTPSGTGASAAQVQGTAAEGAAVTGSPVVIAGKDLSGNVAIPKVDGNNAMYVTPGVAVTPGDAVGNTLNWVNTRTLGSSAGLLVGNYLFNGSSWDRMRGNATGGQYVQGSLADGAAESGNSVKVGGTVFTAMTVAGGAGTRTTFRFDDRSYLWTTIGTGGVLTMDTNGVFTVPKPVTSGGLSTVRLVAATNGVIKASAGQLYTGTFTNTNAAIRYFEVYNKATAGTLSTDTPAITVPLPPNVSVMIDFSGMGGAFSTGISWQVTTDDIAIPTTAGSTTDIHGFVSFK
jgi:hypothetical protein